MRKTAIGLTIFILLIFRIQSEGLEKIGTIKTGKNTDQVQIVHSQIAGEPDSPCGFFISEFDKTITMIDITNNNIKMFNLFSGKHIKTTKPDTKIMNQTLQTVFGNGYYYLSYKGDLLQIDTNGLVINKFKDKYGNTSDLFFLRGDSYIAQSLYDITCLTSNNKIKKTYCPTVNKIVRQVKDKNYNFDGLTYDIYANILSYITYKGFLRISYFNFEDKPKEDSVVWQLPSDAQFSYPKYRHGIQMFFAPSGVAYIIADNGQDLEIWRVIPDNIRGHVFVFGYNELPLVDLARRGLDEAPAQADLDFIASLRPEELKVLKTAPFALEGCNFQDQELQRYFETWDWYLPETKKFAGAGILSPAQQRLVERIKDL